MSVSVLLAAVLVFSGVSIASPLQRRGERISIQQVQHAIVLKNGPGQLVQTLQKFGKEVPKDLQIAANRRQANAGSTPANPTDGYDSSYVCPVEVGNTTVQLDFDTGSSDLWVYSSLQAQSQTSGHSVYQVDPSKEKQGYTWKIGYGDGSGASGKVYVDKVTVGGVTATSQAVEAATSVSASFVSQTKTDGLLGLAFDTINEVEPTKQPTFFDTIRPQLDLPLFAVSLKYHAPGTYDFGFIDNSKYTGFLTYVDVDTSQGFWGFEASGYGIGSAGNVTENAIHGIVDTGTTLIYVDNDIYQAYYSGIPGAKNDDETGLAAFPCSTSLPDFSIVVGGTTLTVPGKYINYSPVKEGSPDCFGGIQSNALLGITIFGDVFLKSSYVVFENSGSKPRLGFAKQA